MSEEEPFYSPTRKPHAKRVAVPGVKQWELRQENRVLTCELRNDDRAGAGFDVQLLEDGELLVSRRCATVEVARDIVRIFKADPRRYRAPQKSNAPLHLDSSREAGVI